MSEPTNKSSRKRKPPQSVFVVCDVRSDIHILVNTLQNLGLRTLNFDNTLFPAKSLAATIKDLIAEADLICVVLAETNNPNVYIELGYALGLRRPTIIISEISQLPSDLSEYLRIKAPLNDQRALTFQLSAVLASTLSIRKDAKEGCLR